MTDFKQRGIRWLLLTFGLTCFLACAAKEPTVIPDTDAESWELKFKGETKGTVKMTLSRKEIGKDCYIVGGKITGSLDDHKAGPGDADYTVEGKIEKNDFNASFSGPSYMEIGAGFIHGQMKGTLFESEGAGTWKVMHPMGSSAGEYSMRRIK